MQHAPHAQLVTYVSQDAQHLVNALQDNICQHQQARRVYHAPRAHSQHTQEHLTVQHVQMERLLMCHHPLNVLNVITTATLDHILTPHAIQLLTLHASRAMQGRLAISPMPHYVCNAYQVNFPAIVLVHAPTAYLAGIQLYKLLQYAYFVNLAHPMPTLQPPSVLNA